MALARSWVRSSKLCAFPHIVLKLRFLPCAHLCAKCRAAAQALYSLRFCGGILETSTGVFSHHSQYRLQAYLQLFCKQLRRCNGSARSSRVARQTCYQFQVISASAVRSRQTHCEASVGQVRM